MTRFVFAIALINAFPASAGIIDDAFKQANLTFDSLSKEYSSDPYVLELIEKFRKNVMALQESVALYDSPLESYLEKMIVDAIKSAVEDCVMIVKLYASVRV